MNFDTHWDAQYEAGKQLSIWPWTDLVSCVMRYTGGDALRVLELGCGAGANIPFFRQIGADYAAVDGSGVIVDRLREMFPNLTTKIRAADFTTEIPFDGPFELIVDRAAVTCNNTAAIENTLSLVHDRLTDDGLFIGIDWYSCEHSDFDRGKPCDDAFTKDGFQDGAFKGLGRVHFSDRTHVLELFDRFEILLLEHKTSRVHIPDGTDVWAAWNVVARKSDNR